MRLREALAFILFGRPVRRRPPGTERLLGDIASLERLGTSGRGSARERLAARISPEVVEQVERRLELEGRLAPETDRAGRGRRAA